MSDVRREMIPEVRTTPRFAVALCVAALAALCVAVFGAEQIQKALESESAATIVLALWCVAATAAAIAGVVDAYIRPEGEQLGLATAIAATVFAVLSLVVLVSLVLGAATGAETRIG